MDGASLHPEVRETAEAIAGMEIRGAATIADAAAAALGAQAAASDADTAAAFRSDLRKAARTLYETRPTAGSLPNALRSVLADLEGDADLEALRRTVTRRVERFRADMDVAQDRLGEIGTGRFADGDVVMTHCHSRT
jgi:ribose 1,5-bisphosphate isomerase